MADTQLLAEGQHGLVAHSHGGDVPVQTRSERIRSTNVADFAPISRREEQWKYTTSDQLAGLDADALEEYAGDIELKAGASATGSWVGADHASFGAAGTPEDRVSAAAWSSAKQAYLVSVAASDDHQVTRLVLSSSSHEPSALHLIIDAAANANHTVVIDHHGDAVLAENVEIIAGTGAHVTVVALQRWNAGSVHSASHFSLVGRDAHLKHIVISVGGDVVRVTPNAGFSGPGASVELLGMYFAKAGQHLEHRLFVDHSEPKCKSRVTYKGALQGDKAHTIWVGDVLIRAAAEGTDTYELNRNLLLTDGARADSVPNLEIETGEIQGAGHASASGRFDDEQLFYLQARGISEIEARRLVVRGFLNEIVQQIGVEDLQEELTNAIEVELERSSN